MEIVQGNAYDLLPSLEPDAFDHIITDSSYGIGITRNDPVVGRSMWDTGEAAFDASGK